MDTGDLLTALDSTKNPLTFIVILVMILAMVSGLVSKAAADYGGVFGTFARAIQRRKEQAIAADEASDARRLDRLEKTIERLDKEIAELRQRDSIHHEYQLYVASYWRDLQFWAVQENVTLPLPTMLAFPEWKRKHYPDSTE